MHKGSRTESSLSNFCAGGGSSPSTEEEPQGSSLHHLIIWTRGSRAGQSLGMRPNGGVNCSGMLVQCAEGPCHRDVLFGT